MKTELKVILVVALVLLGTEVGMRMFQNRLSIDISHINSIPRISDQVAESAPDGETKVLFVGNSLTRSGLNDSMFREELKEQGVDVRTHYIYPDGSSVNLWSFMVRNNFADSEKLPDVMVVAFGRSHLRDSKSDPTILASYAGLSDLGKVVTEESENFDEAAEFVLARASVAFMHRRRVQPRLFIDLLPYYLESYRRLNEIRKEKQTEKEDDETDDAEPGSSQEPTFRRLRELLEATADKGVSVIFVSIPMFEPYEVPEGAISLIREKGAVYADLRSLPIQPADFDDDRYHLGVAGAEKFTGAFVDVFLEFVGRGRRIIACVGEPSR